jgi:Helix-turn-helix domain
LGRCGLSSKELSRVEVIGRVKAGSLRLKEAAELLGLSYRHAKRVWARYRGGVRKPAALTAGYVPASISL